MNIIEQPEEQEPWCAVEELGLCGCGQPWDADAFLLAALRHIENLRTEVWDVEPQEAQHAAWEKWDQRGLEVFGNAGSRMFVLYVFDQMGLTEHGGSVGGSWLTAKGMDFLKRLEAQTALQSP